MKNLFFTDYPRHLSCNDYDAALDRMVQKLSKHEGVVSIYQIGSVSTPGISDLDLFVVFDDAVTYRCNPLAELSFPDRYLFKHALFGCTRTYFAQIEKFTLFHNYKLLWGPSELQPLTSAVLSEPEHTMIKTQIALEYLIKMYISLAVQLSYNVVQIRNLLLHVKAVSYDLDMLGIMSGRLFDAVKTMLKWRQSWFDSKPDTKQLERWFCTFFIELQAFLTSTLNSQPFYLPQCARRSISPHLHLRTSTALGFERQGLVLPQWISRGSKKMRSVQNRLCTFFFDLPSTAEGIPAVLLDRYRFITEAGQHNVEHLPYFLPTAYGLNVFRRNE